VLLDPASRTKGDLMLTLFAIALGAFAIGTEGFMLAGLLPAISGDLGVSLSAAGQLVTVFSLTYALGSPVLAVATGNLDRKRLLMGSMTVFALGNVIAANAHTYGTLLTARITMALAASTYMPAASAYAATAAAPERRGRALSVIYAGLTLATVIGVPLGVLVGGRYGWRPTFLGVAGLAALAVAGLWRELAAQAAARTASFAERLAAARRPEVLGALVLTSLALTGTFVVYTYLAPFLGQAVGLEGPGVALVLFLFGAGGAVGNVLGGVAADRFRSRRILGMIFASLAALFVLLSVAGRYLPPPIRLPAVVGLILLWGLIAWAFPSVQQTRLVRLDPRLAPVTLSLNASATYLGVSLGAALGSLAMAYRGALSLGLLAGACELVGLLVLRRAPEHPPSRRGQGRG
jgi:predicted MFS family arabinose efflux permease